MIADSNKSRNHGRAGSYVSQIGGYRAFIPTLLPPDPPIQIDDELLQLLSQANIALGRLDGASELLPNADLFVAMYVHKEAVLSSQIEGTQAYMGRLLITFILCCERVLKRPLLYLSHFLKMNKLEYYECLQKVRDEGDWENWLKFFLRGVYDVAQEATATARNIVLLREHHRTIVTGNFARSTSSAYKLLEHLYMRPIITVSGVATVTGLSYANASHLVTKFRENGLLREMTQLQRNRRFAYAEYLSMFTDEPFQVEGEVIQVHQEDTTQSS